MERKENLAAIIAENLVYYRKKAQLTQSELAEKINYSDKSVSKWERAEGVPDIYILDQLADLYGLTVNDFLTTKKKQRIAKMFVSKLLITLLSVGLVWFISTFAFSVLTLFVPELNNYWQIWLLFIYAIPVTSIILIIFNKIYFKRILNVFPVSLLCWSIALSLHLTFTDIKNITVLYIIVIPLQVLVIFFYLLQLKRTKK